ncbi:MAG: hypothetical protein VW800_10185, partial [Acidimicrobiaceae bacterium]
AYDDDNNDDDDDNNDDDNNNHPSHHDLPDNPTGHDPVLPDDVALIVEARERASEEAVVDLRVLVGVAYH